MPPVWEPSTFIVGQVPSVVEREPTCVVVWMRGEHDLASAGPLAGVLAHAADLGETDVVVDLSGVDFMDASTLGVLVTARLDLRGGARSLTCRAPSASAQRVLRICGLADPVCATPEGVATG